MNAPAKVGVPTGLDLLRQPFPDHQISTLPKPYKKDSPKGRCQECGGYHGLPAVHLSYVGHAALTDRLLDADPNWYWEPVAFTQDGLPAFDRTGGLWIKLTVCGVTRLGYGCADGKTGGDAVKEIIGDALRNAAMRFGAALDLWHKGDLHLDAEPESGPEDKAGGNARSASGPDANDPITDEQMVKLQSLIKATSTEPGALLLHLGAPKGKQLCDMPQKMFGRAVELLEQRLADMAKGESNAKAESFGELLSDEIPY